MMTWCSLPSLLSRASGLLVVALWLGCTEPSPTPTTGSNSNWLRACQSDADCSNEGECACGACTLPCTDDDGCRALSGAVCAAAESPAAWAQCQSQAGAQGICLPACTFGSCDDGQACVAGRCVLLPMPDSALCQPFAEHPPEERALEDELLALVQETRRAGGVSCPGADPSAPAPALRLDARLTCAARVLAADLEVTQSRSLVDSQGRSTTDRLALVGYMQSTWGEALGFGDGTAASALNVLLGDGMGCPRIVDAAYLDVGVGSAGDAQVVTLASE